VFRGAQTAQVEGHPAAGVVQGLAMAARAKEFVGWAAPTLAPLPPILRAPAIGVVEPKNRDTRWQMHPIEVRNTSLGQTFEKVSM
jgi:hypothetical protein